MKRGLTLILVLCSISVAAQNEQKDSIHHTVKKGWMLGVLPAIGYSSDLGFQYGVLADLFDFGDGSTYPKYNQKFNVEVSGYTKGSGVYHLFYDAESPKEGFRSTIDISYLTDRMLDFYGFNGYKSNYDKDLPSVFYKMDRKLFRISTDFQGRIKGNLKWAFGLGYYNYKIEAAENDLEYDGTLYEKMCSNGMITSDEKNGGQIVELKLGLVHDSRNLESDPTRGFFTQAIFSTSPPFKNDGNRGYSRISIIHRGYIPISGDKATFAYRIGYQNRTGGNIPFYALQNITTLYFKQITSEGLGGINTIRGVLRNRIVGNGVALANAEFRYRFCNFRFFGQDWYLVANPFIDAGKVTENYPAYSHLYELSNHLDVNPNNSIPSTVIYDSLKREKIHWSAGLGIKAVMSKNFVISAEFGKPFNKQDGSSGFNLGLNYIF